MVLAILKYGGNCMGFRSLQIGQRAHSVRPSLWHPGMRTGKRGNEGEEFQRKGGRKGKEEEGDKEGLKRREGKKENMTEEVGEGGREGGKEERYILLFYSKGLLVVSTQHYHCTEAHMKCTVQCIHVHVHVHGVHIL